MNQPIEEKCSWQEEFDSLYEDVLNFAICCEGSSLDCACNRQTVLTNVKGFIENLLEQERTEKPCCVAELGCLCPGKDGMSEHDSENCLCPEHYAKHEEWLRHILSLTSK